jgi:TolB-like protein
MAIWSAEIKEIEKLCESLKGQFPDLEKELERLIKADDENMILLYSRRCLEVINTDLCECELSRPRKSEPLKGIIDKLHKERKVPSHIITSMHGLSELSTYGAHPKDFDPEQVKPVLVNLDIIIKWYLKYKDFQIVGKQKSEEEKTESKPAAISTLGKSLIVLPFENISPDPDQEYFSDGLTEEIITDLSHINNLLVISRSSAMTFKGTKKTIPEIVKSVNVRYVLKGSVRKAGNNLRITAQLIDGMTDTHLWADKYNGKLDDVFDIQERVSQSIADALKIRLNPEEKKRIAHLPIENVKAYEYYFRAKQAMDAWTESELSQAEQLLQKALEIEGENALLYSQLRYINYQYWNLGYRIDEKCLKTASEYVNKIFAIDADSIHGFFLRGTLELAGENVQKSIHDYNRVLSFDPNYAEVLFWLSAWLTFLGKAISAIDKLGKEIPQNYVFKLLNVLKSALLGEKSPLGSLDSNLERWAKKDSSYSLAIAECYSITQETGKAIEWLNLSINLGSINYPFLNEYDPLLKNIRNDERFKKLMERVKYEWKNFEV